MSKTIGLVAAATAITLTASAASAQSTYPATEYRAAAPGQNAALLLPAVQAAREAARRNSQANRTYPGGLRGGSTVVNRPALRNGNQIVAPDMIMAPDMIVAPDMRRTNGIMAPDMRGATGRGVNSSTPLLGREGNDLLIVNNGDGSDFMQRQLPRQTAGSFNGSIRVATGDVNN